MTTNEHTEQSERAEPVITDAMVTAYLEANEKYWVESDKLPTPPNRWRTGNPRDATRAGLAAALLSADKAGGEVVSIKAKLVHIHDALSNKLGDTDPYFPDDMTDDEVAQEMPVFWAAKEIAALIGDAPWDQYASPHPQPVPDDVVKDAAMLNWMLEHVVTGGIGFGDWWISADEPASEWKSALRAAMLKEEK